MYLKGIADRDDILRQEIQDGIRRWDTENLLDENSDYFLHSEDNCIPPVVELHRKTDLLGAVQLQYYGKPDNPELEDFLYGNCQIFDWHNPKGLLVGRYNLFF